MRKILLMAALVGLAMNADAAKVKKARVAKIAKSLHTTKEFILFLYNPRAHSLRWYTLFIYIAVPFFSIKQSLSYI